MDVLMLAGLAGLALIDSTSLGTLVIPIWMMLAPRLRVSRFLIYLGTVAVFYALVGVALVLGAEAAQRAFAGLGDSPVVNWVQLVIGVALFAVSFRFDSKRSAARQQRRAAAGHGPSRVERWRARVTGPDATVGAVMGLGLTAAALEVATMLPYLAAVGIITAAGLSVVQWVPLLLGYCVVMVLPAIVLLGLRLAARRRLEPLLERIGAWMTKHSAGTLGWVLGIAGFLLARDAAFRLSLLGS